MDREAPRSPAGADHPGARIEAFLRGLAGRNLSRFLMFSAVALVVSLFLQFQSPGIPDPDSFYHFRHAALYADKGLWMTDFPWLAYSIINRYSADIGYGFHFLLIPFTLLGNDVFGLKLAAALACAVVLILVYWVMRRHRVAFDFAWPFLLLFLAPPMVFTFLMTRPQTLTMGFLALLLSFLVLGSPWAVLLASFAISFVHLNVFPVIPAVVLVVGLTQLVTERRWEWRKWLAALGGIGLGWLLRPNPIGVAKLEYVQIVVHELVRHQRTPLMFGQEWTPVSPAALSAFLYFLLFWITTAVVFVIAASLRRIGASPRDRTLLWSSLLLSAVFFAATVLVTKRTTPLWATCAVIFSAKAFTCLLDPLDKRPDRFLKEEARLLIAFSLAAVFALMVWDGVNQHVLQRRWPGIPPRRLQAAADWLGRNSRPGDVVFNVDWGLFPELFFWGPQNRYVSGLDPIFLYAYDQSLYWQSHHLAADDTGAYTCGVMVCAPEKREDTYTVLKRDFRASHIVLSPSRSPALDSYLRRDPRFALGFRDAGVAVYKLE